MSATAKITRLGRALGKTALTGAALGVSTLAWGSIERRMPIVRNYTLTLPAKRKISPITVLQIADLHMYPGQEFIIDFLDQVAQDHSYDFIIATGDNFGDTNALDLIQRAYAPFSGTPGAFVFGSNDYYSPRRRNWARYVVKNRWTTSQEDLRTVPDLPFEELRTYLLDLGWVDLNNASATVALGTTKLALTGVDDPHIKRDRPVPLPSTWGTEGVLTVGVTHAPYRRVLDGWTVAGADLIMAGHTHGGQLGLPGVTSLVTNCDLPRSHGKGLHPWEVTDLTPYVGDSITEPLRSWLHVSAGLGTSPYAPFRIATRPEVSIIRIKSAPQ